MKSLIFILFFPLAAMSQSLTMEVQQYFYLKDFNKAENILLKILKDNPYNIEAIELLGDSYGHQTKWDDAIKLYKELVDSIPNNANYHYKYGGALGMKALSVNKLKALTIVDDVKEAFLKAAELDPNHIDTRWALVELYMQLPGIIGGSKSKSLKYANELKALSKVDGYLAKGYIYEYDDEPELAEKYYKMAITEGDSFLCYRRLINLYIGLKEYNTAIHYLEIAYTKFKSEEIIEEIKVISNKYNVPSILISE